MTVSHPLWWHSSESVCGTIYCVFTYIYSLLIEPDICDHQNISVKLPCVCVCLLSGNLLISSVRVSSYFSYFCRYNGQFSIAWGWLVEWNSFNTICNNPRLTSALTLNDGKQHLRGLLEKYPNFFFAIFWWISIMHACMRWPWTFICMR
jgi:hypothetical protein